MNTHILQVIVYIITVLVYYFVLYAVLHMFMIDH